MKSRLLLPWLCCLILASPLGLAAQDAIDVTGNRYVADSANHVILRIAPDGRASTLAGLVGVAGCTDGTGADARFNYPAGVAIDAAGMLYVADRGNSSIRKVTPAGAVTTYAGSARTQGHVDGPGGSARFVAPLAVTLDRGGNLYVADGGFDRLRKIAPDGSVTTLADRAVKASGSADDASEPDEGGDIDGSDGDDPSLGPLPGDTRIRRADPESCQVDGGSAGFGCHPS